PLALEGAPGRVDPPPVALGEAAAADAHHADLAVRGRRAVVRLEPHLVAGRRHTDRAGDDPTASVRAIDVEHLRRADPVEDRDAEAAVPLVEERFGKRLAGGYGDAHRRQ